MISSQTVRHVQPFDKSTNPAASFPSFQSNFASRDPIGYEGTELRILSLTQFVGGNPLNFVDPSGLMWILPGEGPLFGDNNYIFPKGLFPKPGLAWPPHISPPPYDWGPCWREARNVPQSCGQHYHNCTATCKKLWLKKKCLADCQRANDCCDLAGAAELEDCEFQNRMKGTLCEHRTKRKKWRQEHKKLGCKNDFDSGVPVIPNQPYDPNIF